MTSIRFNGIYQHDDRALRLRFFANSKVGGRFLEGKSPASATAQLLWPGLGAYGEGTYEVTGEDVELRLKLPVGDRHYRGKVVEDGIQLKLIQPDRDPPPILYLFHPLSEAELSPPQDARVHALRQALASAQIGKSHVEAASAIGDPDATLALQPYVDSDRVAQHFAALSAAACLRVLFSLSWSDDGVWYTPRQGVVTGGSKKEDEGKTLRALAKWCLKPDAKLLSKAQEEFKNVIKVGPGYQFLEAAMRVAQAESEADRASAMKDALTLHLAQDVIYGYELVRAKVVPWLLGTGDPLADMLKTIK